MSIKEYSDSGKRLDVVSNKPIVSGRLIEGVNLSTSPTTINHGLGRNVQGYIIVKSTSGVTVYFTPSDFPKRTLILTASADSTVSVWVF